jgi:hypothetical protein
LARRVDLLSAIIAFLTPEKRDFRKVEFGRDEALLALRLALRLSVLARPKRQRFQQRPWRISTTKRDQVHEAIP